MENLEEQVQKPETQGDSKSTNNENVIWPTVGRQVHYFQNGQDSEVAHNGAEFNSALVSQTGGGSKVNLHVSVMDETKPVVVRFSVPHKSELKEFGGEIETSAYWDWPVRN